ncbi:MAG: hypothetical protein CFE45_25495, partial [Burkholderiales bacterium PBB5]
MARPASRMLLALLRNAIRWMIFRDQWSIRIFEKGGAALGAETGSLGLQALTHLRPDNGAFWADPFLYRHADGRWWVFCEAL